MKTYKLTLERQDETWGQYDIRADSPANALRVAARAFDLDGAKAVHIVEMKG